MRNILQRRIVLAFLAVWSSIAAAQDDATFDEALEMVANG